MTSAVPLPRRTPQEAGVDPGLIRSFHAAFEALGQELHSFILVKDGAVIHERWWRPYQPHEPHLLYSLSKSFTSTAVGLAISEGRLTLDDHLIDFFPDELPAVVSENLRNVRIRHLLSMSVGHEVDSVEFMGSTPDGDWPRAFLARPVEREPGTHFVYNSGATYMLSVIVERLTAMGLLDYLRPRLFDPIGIGHVSTDRCPRGHAVGGWGMRMTTDSIARFGKLLLAKGVWDGRAVLPEGWVDLATSKHVSNGDDPVSDWAAGYGFQYWRCAPNCYRGDGAFGQNCVVVDDLGLAIITTGRVDDLQALLTLFWTHFVAPMREGRRLDADFDLAAPLECSAPQGSVVSPTMATISGRRYRSEDSAVSFSFDFGMPVPTLTFARGDKEETFEVGFGAWLDGETRMDGWRREPISVRAAWATPQTLVVRVRLRETPAYNDYRFEFAGDEARVTPDYQGRLWFEGPGAFVAHAE